MKEPYEKGLATHLGPEPCVDVRKDIGEASVGVRGGWVLSHEMVYFPGADAVGLAEGNTGRAVSARPAQTRRGPRPQHLRKLSAREPGDPAIGWGGWCLSPYREV